MNPDGFIQELDDKWAEDANAASILLELSAARQRIKELEGCCKRQEEEVSNLLAEGDSLRRLLTIARRERDEFQSRWHVDTERYKGILRSAVKGLPPDDPLVRDLESVLV